MGRQDGFNAVSIEAAKDQMTRVFFSLVVNASRVLISATSTFRVPVHAGGRMLKVCLFLCKQLGNEDRTYA